LILVRGLGCAEFGELGMKGSLRIELMAVALAGEVDEALVDGVEAALDGAAERFGGGFVVGAKAVEAGVEGDAEIGDDGGDLGTQWRGSGWAWLRPRPFTRTSRTWSAPGSCVVPRRSRVRSS